MFDHDEVIIGPDDEIGIPGSGVFGRRVVFPTFEIFSNPSIQISDVKSRRFDLMDRAVQKARQQIMNQEDENILDALEAIASGNKDS